MFNRKILATMHRKLQLAVFTLFFSIVILSWVQNAEARRSRLEALLMPEYQTSDESKDDGLEGSLLTDYTFKKYKLASSNLILVRRFIREKLAMCSSPEECRALFEILAQETYTNLQRKKDSNKPFRWGK